MPFLSITPLQSKGAPHRWIPLWLRTSDLLIFSPGKCIQSWAPRLRDGPRQRTKKSGKSGDLGEEVIGRARIRCRLKRRVSKTTFLLWIPGEVVRMIILWTTHRTRKMNVSYLPEEEGVIDNAGTKCHLRRSLIQIVWTRALEIFLSHRLWTNCPHQQAGGRAETWSHLREKDTWAQRERTEDRAD